MQCLPEETAGDRTTEGERHKIKSGTKKKKKELLSLGGFSGNTFAVESGQSSTNQSVRLKETKMIKKTSISIEVM